MESQRAAGGGKTHHLQEDRPNHQLLVQDWFVPPATYVIEFKAGSKCPGKNQPEERVQEEFPRVERAGLFGCAEAFFDPVKL